MRHTEILVLVRMTVRFSQWECVDYVTCERSKVDQIGKACPRKKLIYRNKDLLGRILTTNIMKLRN